ncbi:SAV_2336 N-terminal domain-related protein [Kitasatospora sp. NPDC051705]|uniref:SAV_2336 N-terminal domain-related protein n=1 Tax=Kitasatospora sp. NPDC051705 TaxID=3364057 RepID=UPI0037A6EA12
MREDVARLVAALSRALPPDTDATTVADLLWLAAAEGRGADDRAGEPASGPSPRDAAQVSPGHDPGTGPGLPAPQGRPDDVADDTGVPLYEDLPAGPAPGRSIQVAAGRALPRSLELARALRPFKRRYPRGARRALDIDATLREYTRGGELAPVFGPVPEAWFDVVILVDTHPTMDVWRDTVDELDTLLAGIGAFRGVRRLRLSVDGEPTITDGRGRAVGRGRVTAPGGRRLLVVLSDCTAPGWREPAVWQLLRTWGSTTPVVLLNPLPGRLWSRTALDLPAVRVRQDGPAARNTDLRYELPLMTSALFGPGPLGAAPSGAAPSGTDPGWTPLPTLALTPHSLRRWADAVMRGAPAGHDAVLVPASGVLRSPFAAHAPRRPDDTPNVAAFLHTASPAAKRLACLSSPFSSLSLPLLQLIRQEAVPDATVGDLAELLTSGLVDTRTVADGPTVLTFRAAARAALAPLLTRHDAWTVHAALTRHVAARRPRAGNGLAAVAVADTASLPPELRPFATASAELLALLDGSRPRHAPEADVLPMDPTDSDPMDEREDPEFPDPRRSAALLIGVSRYPSMPELPHVPRTVTDLAALLSSSNSWGLSPDRCHVLLDPGSRTEALEAIRAATRQATDALLVYFAGHNSLIDGETHLVLGDGSSLPLHRFANDVGSPGAERVVLLVDLFDDVKASRPALDPDRMPNNPIVELLVTQARPAEPARGLIASALMTVGATGLPDAPETLELAHIRRGMLPINATWWLSGTSREAPPLAILHNRQAPDYLEPHVRTVFDQVCSTLQTFLEIAYPAHSHDDVRRILRTLIGFAHDYVAQGPDGHAPALQEALEADLGAALAQNVALIRNGDDESDLACSEVGGAFHIPIDVRTVRRHRGLSPVDIIMTRRFSSPLTVTIVLDQSGGARDRSLFNISPRVGLAGGGSQPHVDLVLRVPVEESDPASLEEALRRAVTRACEDLAGGSIEFNDEGGPSVPELPGATEATISFLEPKDSTIDWYPVETYDGGTVVGEVKVTAELTLEAFLHKADVFLEDGLTILDEVNEVNEHMVEVSVTLLGELSFHAQVDGPEFDVQLELADIKMLR